MTPSNAPDDSRATAPAYAGIFMLVVALLSGYVVRHFVLPVLWAAILAIATWPLYLYIRQRMKQRRVPAAFLCTLLVAIVFIAPIIYLLITAGQQAPAIARTAVNINEHGIAAPDMLTKLPLLGEPIRTWWDTTLAMPHGLAHLLSGNATGRLGSAAELLRIFGTRTLHTAVTFGFALASLFFFYLDGEALRAQVDAIGQRSIGGQRWSRYIGQVPLAIHSTVNGLVLVGLGEGLLLGISYAIAGLPSAVLLGALTAALAVVPFGALAAYVGVTLYLLATNATVGAIGVFVWGTLVLLIADHVVRPRIIGDATKLPFLIVLFGLLGGVESFGLIGLFLGPAIMALFVTLWREPEEERDSRRNQNVRQ